MSALTRLAATVGCLFIAASTFIAVEAQADGRKTIQTEAGVIVADYRPGNIPPSDAIVVGPGQTWQGYLDLDSDDGELKFYVANPTAIAGDRPWRQYWAKRIDCGGPGYEDAFVTVAVDGNGLAVIRCEVGS
jgi:hypothetical protein